MLTLQLTLSGLGLQPGDFHFSSRYRLQILNLGAQTWRKALKGQHCPLWEWCFQERGCSFRRPPGSGRGPDGVRKVEEVGLTALGRWPLVSPSLLLLEAGTFPKAALQGRQAAFPAAGWWESAGEGPENALWGSGG